MKERSFINIARIEISDNYNYETAAYKAADIQLFFLIFLKP